MSRPQNGSRSTEPPVSLDHEPEKRRAILHAAVRVFAEKGYHGCRIADVARQAGVAYGLVYHYFEDKEELLESVFAEQWTIFLRALRAIADGPGPAAEQLSGICRFAVEVFRTSPAAVRVLLLEATRAPRLYRSGSTRRTFQEALRTVGEVVARGQDRGELRRDLDPLVVAASVLGALELCLTGMVTGILGDPAGDAAQKVEHGLIELLLSGVRAPAGPAAGSPEDAANTLPPAPPSRT